MKASLVLATLNRTLEVKHFLETLSHQTYRDFEVIVVDQNLDDRLVPILESFKDHFPIIHLRSTPGLSHARNVALAHISGDMVAFPDDDCAYPPTLLEQVAQFFTKHTEWNGLTGQSVNQQGQDSARLDHQSGQITPFNVWRRGISYTIFLRKEVVVKTGFFDESLGVGANTPWGSGEETDYLLRAIDDGLYYNSNIMVIHPIKAEPSEIARPIETAKPQQRHVKTYSYAMGRGRVLRKHNAPLWFVIYNWTRPLAGVTLSLLRGRSQEARSHWATFQGRVQGWIGWA